MRKRILAELDGDELDQQRVLACAVRLLDVGMFRIGSEQYADEEGGVGLATVTKSNVTLANGEVIFDYLGKSGVRRVQAVQDPLTRDVVAALKRRRVGGEQLLAYRQGRRWQNVRSDQINEYLKRAHGRGGHRQGLPDLERHRSGRRLAGRRRP